MKLSKAKAALDKTLKVSSKDVKLSGSLSQLFFNARKGQTVLCGIAASDEGNKALTSTELTALTIGGRPSEPKLMPHAKGLLTHGLSSSSSFSQRSQLFNGLTQNVIRGLCAYGFCYYLPLFFVAVYSHAY